MCCLARAASADITVTAGHYVMSLTANQTMDGVTLQPIAIMVSNDGDYGLGIQGVNLVISIGDQTSTPPVQPTITAVDLIGPGTIFNGNNTGQGGAVPAPGSTVAVSTTTSSGYVVPSGVLAYLTIDSTGVAPGTYPIILHRTFPPVFPPLETNFPTDQPIGTVNLVAGSIGSIPEPRSIVLALLAAAGLGAVAVRRRFRNPGR